MDKIFGLPAHPLLVHIPVVLVPLALLGALLIAFSARLRARLGWTVAVIAVLGGLGAVLAAGAGESLEDRINETRTLEDHEELGEIARLMGVLFAVVVVAFVAGEWWLRRRAARVSSAAAQEDPSAPASPASSARWMRWLVPAAAVLMLGVGAGATYAMVDAGHSGAKATWDDKANSGGERDDYDKRERDHERDGYRDDD